MIDFVRRVHSKPYLKETRSVIDIISYRAIIFIASFFYALKYRKIIKKTNNKISEIKKEVQLKNKFAIVLANGPSVGDIDLEKLKKISENGYDIIAINSYMSNSAQVLPPTFAVFADPVHFSKDRNKFTRDIELCEELGVTYFTPARHADMADSLRFGFCNMTNLDSSNINDLTRPAGYYGLSALFALTLAKMIGYKRIYICGFDNSYFQDFVVGNSRDMYIRHRHYYDEDIEETIVPCIYEDSTEFFFDTYRYFQYMKKINKDGNIFNLAKFTYISEISRDLSLDIYKS
jgi:hypothetical protein